MQDLRGARPDDASAAQRIVEAIAEVASLAEAWPERAGGTLSAAPAFVRAAIADRDRWLEQPPESSLAPVLSAAEEDDDALVSAQEEQRSVGEIVQIWAGAAHRAQSLKESRERRLTVAFVAIPTALGALILGYSGRAVSLDAMLSLGGFGAVVGLTFGGVIAIVVAVAPLFSPATAGPIKLTQPEGERVSALVEGLANRPDLSDPAAMIVRLSGEALAGRPIQGQEMERQTQAFLSHLEALRARPATRRAWELVRVACVEAWKEKVLADLLGARSEGGAEGAPAWPALGRSFLRAVMCRASGHLAFRPLAVSPAADLRQVNVNRGALSIHAGSKQVLSLWFTTGAPGCVRVVLGFYSLNAARDPAWRAARDLMGTRFPGPLPGGWVLHDAGWRKLAYEAQREVAYEDLATERLIQETVTALVELSRRVTSGMGL